jgi:hypothetical protein
MLIEKGQIKANLLIWHVDYSKFKILETWQVQADLFDLPAIS